MQLAEPRFHAEYHKARLGCSGGRGRRMTSFRLFRLIYRSPLPTLPLRHWNWNRTDISKIIVMFTYFIGVDYDTSTKRNM